jgi:hypothetical protein
MDQLIELLTRPEVIGAIGVILSALVGNSETFGGEKWKTAKRVFRAYEQSRGRGK